jgi:hypothetical protein
MKVNSDAQVANLNSDKVDGKSATEIGVNGRELVSNSSLNNSNSSKGVGVSCPPGKVVVGPATTSAAARSAPNPTKRPT